MRGQHKRVGSGEIECGEGIVKEGRIRCDEIENS